VAARDPDRHKGAIEGDRPDDEQHGNPNAPSLDSEGLPGDTVPIAEDRIGANVDDWGEVSHANELGHTSDAPREEIEPLASNEREP
jgi:hypothetical protein